MLKKWKKRILGSCMVAVMVCTIFTSNVSAKEIISSETIISKDNIRDVCIYLGIDSDEIIWRDDISSNINTVGELESVIAKTKSNILEVVTNDNTIETFNNSDINFARASSSKTLSRTFNNDGYTFKVSVAVKYANKKFLSAGSPKVSVSGSAGPIIYKYYKDTLKSSCIDTKVSAIGDVTVNSYAGVANIGLVKIGTQTSKVRCFWYANSSL